MMKKKSVLSNLVLVLIKLAMIPAFVLCFFPTSLQAQSTDAKPITVYPSFGVGVGFFYPGDVNEYIEESLASYVEEYGTKEIFTCFEFHSGLTFRIKRVDFSGILDYAIAPKIIFVSDGDNITFMFTRLSPGISSNFYIPYGSGRHSFFIGGALQYHFMWFEGMSANNPGFRIQAGTSLQFGNFNLQPYAAFVYARAQTTNEIQGYGNESFDMNYTNGQIGVFLSFHPQIAHN